MKNKTKYRTLDRFERDPRVESIWSEGDDGIFVALAPGYRFEDCINVHEWTVKDVLRSMATVERCLDCPKCRSEEIASAPGEHRCLVCGCQFK